MTMTRCIRTWFVMALFWKGTFSSRSISGPTQVGSDLGSPLSVIAVGPTCAGGSPDKAHHSPYQFFFLFFFLLSLSPSLNWNRFVCIYLFRLANFWISEFCFYMDACTPNFQLLSCSGATAFNSDSQESEWVSNWSFAVQKDGIKHIKLEATWWCGILLPCDGEFSRENSFFLKKIYFWLVKYIFIHKKAGTNLAV